MAQLRIVEGPGAGFLLTLSGQRVTMGRDDANAIQLGDPKASRIHAEITCVKKRYTLRDLGSSNGIWNDEGKIEQCILEDGALFRIGKTYLCFELEDSDTPQHTIAYEGDEAAWALKSLGGLDGESALFASSVIQNPRIREAHDCLVLLHEVVLGSHKAHNRDELFEILDDSAAESLEGDRCAVFLPTADGWTLWPAHERRLRARFGNTPFVGTLLKEVRRTQEPVLCSADGDVAPSRSMVQAGVRSAMAAPIRIGDELQALIYVDRLDGESAFGHIHLEFLQAVANQMAVRLYNYDHVAELEAKVTRLQHEDKQTGVHIIGSDASMKPVHRFIEKAAPTQAPVLILGASGTGKELVARSIHQQSTRADNVLQVVNCAAIAENLVESVLFGHVKGAFTGADDSCPGLFELADQGTLFLDEIGELPLPAQAKLLRALEQGDIQRIGEGHVRHVDVRIIAATNRCLEEEVKNGNFREDLYHRLDVLTVHIPALAERPADIDALIDFFLKESGARLGDDSKPITSAARACLLRYEWPGNVRQLRNVIERMTILSNGPTIDVDDLPENISGSDNSTNEHFVSPIAPLSDIERMHILRVLEHCGGNKKAASEMLEIDRSTLYAKLRMYGAL